jgi:hypothetical protein
MTTSRFVVPLLALVAGLGLAAAGAPAQASSWGVSVGGYGSGYHYSVGYRDHGRHYRHHRYYAPVTGQRYRGGYRHQPTYAYRPVYRAPRYQLHVGHYYGYPYGYPTSAHYGYAAPVVVHSYASRPYGQNRYASGVRYYDHQPAPRRGYDRTGYGNQYPVSQRQYAYDELDESDELDASEVGEQQLQIEDAETYQAYPEDRPGRIERR